MPDRIPTVEEVLKAQAEEYGQYVAVQLITHDGAPAYQPGHPVPAGNVALYGYDKDGLVEAVKPARKTAEKGA